MGTRAVRSVKWPLLVTAVLTRSPAFSPGPQITHGASVVPACARRTVRELAPLIIIGKLEQYDYAGATAVAVVMLVISFILLLIINALQAWQRRHAGAPA